METNDQSQLDPRAVNATSVKAEDENAESKEPEALKITAASSNPKMFTLPWHKPLATWPQDLLANLPRGISRHVVRFVHVGDEVYAMKEITRQVAEREYEILRRLQKLELPTVTPIAVVIGRHTREGEPLEAILVTRHLKFSLPYRALFARNLRPDTAERLIDALAVTAVLLMDGLDDGGIFGSVLIADGGGVILDGTIVHQNDLGLLACAQQRFDAVTHIGCGIVAGHGKGDKFLLHIINAPFYVAWSMPGSLRGGMDICVLIIAFSLLKIYPSRSERALIAHFCAK